MKEIDWEQRRYEIAKAMLPYAATKYWRNTLLTKADKVAALAVEYADTLIFKLKKTSK